MPSTAEIAFSSALLLSLGAAISDSRSGTIPNALTIPPLVLAPIVYGTLLGYEHAAKSVVGAVLSLFVPYLLFRQRAMGGGDVKLFAALGAVAGFAPTAGLRIQWMTFVAALVQAVSVLIVRRRLFETLRQMFCMVVGRKSASPAGAELALTPIRLGGAVLIATFVQAIPHLSAFGIER